MAKVFIVGADGEKRPTTVPELVEMARLGAIGRDTKIEALGRIIRAEKIREILPVFDERDARMPPAPPEPEYSAAVPPLAPDPPHSAAAPVYGDAVSYVAPPPVPEVAAPGYETSLADLASPKKKLQNFNKGAIVALIIGVLLMIYGSTLSPASTGGWIIAPESLELKHCRFGADFYTEAYQGLETIVDGLDSINKSAYQQYVSIQSVNRNITEAAGAVVVALGAVLSGIALIFLKRPLPPPGA